MATVVPAAVMAALLIGRLALQLSASIGVAEYPAADATIEALVTSADRAMYQAKAAGKGACDCRQRGLAAVGFALSPDRISSRHILTGG